MTIPVIIISLRRSTERRARIVEQMQALGIPFRFFDAIDGREHEKRILAEYGEISYPGQYGRNLTATEIACALSHLAVIRSAAEGDDDFVCVLEDDATLSPDTPKLLQRHRLQALPAFDLLKICATKKWSKRAFRLAEVDGTEIWAPVQAGLLATGQIYSRSGAAKIARALLPLRGPFDNLLYRDARIPGLRMLESRPGLIGSSRSASTIGDKPAGVRTPRSIARRKLFLLRCYVASLKNFVAAWGWRSLLVLRA